jgi:hypothetical protein
MSLQTILAAKECFVNHKDKIVFYADSREKIEKAFSENGEYGVHWIKLGTSLGYEIVGISSTANEFVHMWPEKYRNGSDGHARISVS